MPENYVMLGLLVLMIQVGVTGIAMVTNLAALRLEAREVSEEPTTWLRVALYMNSALIPMALIFGLVVLAVG